MDHISQDRLAFCGPGFYGWQQIKTEGGSMARQIDASQWIRMHVQVAAGSSRIENEGKYMTRNEKENKKQSEGSGRKIERFFFHA